MALQFAVTERRNSTELDHGAAHSKLIRPSSTHPACTFPHLLFSSQSLCPLFQGAKPKRWSYVRVTLNLRPLSDGTSARTKPLRTIKNRLLMFTSDDPVPGAGNFVGNQNMVCERYSQSLVEQNREEAQVGSFCNPVKLTTEGDIHNHRSKFSIVEEGETATSRVSITIHNSLYSCRDDKKKARRKGNKLGKETEVGKYSVNRKRYNNYVVNERKMMIMIMIAIIIVVYKVVVLFMVVMVVAMMMISHSYIVPTNFQPTK